MYECIAIYIYARSHRNYQTKLPTRMKPVVFVGPQNNIGNGLLSATNFKNITGSNFDTAIVISVRDYFGLEFSRLLSSNVDWLTD